MNHSKNTAKGVKVKVCGITSVEQAVAMDQMGVDYLGFNFWPKSKRYIKPENAKEIVKQLNHAQAVGIFVDAPVEQVQKQFQEAGLQWAQFHGSESVEEVSRVGLPGIKALPIHTGQSDNQVDLVGHSLEPWIQEPSVEFFLFDTASAGVFGGTGEAFDWSILSSSKFSQKPYFLAGGLGVHNLKDALRQSSPYAVDLNSKVEQSPGVKDLHLVEECLAIVRETTTIANSA